MNELTLKDLEDKLERVKVDINLITSGGGDGRKLEVLNEYKQLLEEEIEDAKRAGR